MRKRLSRLIALLLAWLLLLVLPGCSLAEATPIEALASQLLAAQSALTQASEAIAATDAALSALEQQYEKNPDSTKLQDRLIDAMIAQEAALDAHSETLATLMVLQSQQAHLAESADCEDWYVEARGQYAALRITVTVDADMVIYGLRAEIDGSERDQLVGQNDYLYQFIGKAIPLTLGTRKTDDVAPLPEARDTSRALVEALNSLAAAPPTDEPSGPIITPQGIADYLFQHGRLPENFITKKEAQALGWDARFNHVSDVAPGKSIGGDRFGNYEGLLPAKKGRTWYEADCFYTGGPRGAHRILYSSDGLVYYTDDHYQSFTQLFPSK